MIPDHQPPLATLRLAAKRRKAQAFAPGTSANHTAQFSMYLQFCLTYNLQDINPTVDTIILYTEYLAQKFHSHKSVYNYISGVRLLHKLLGITAPSLYSFDLSLMLRATKMTMTTTPQPKLPITPAILLQLCSQSAMLGEHGIVVQCALAFGFFAFLRQSNLAPSSAVAFDPRKHTCRGDIITQQNGLVLILKWSKTIRMGSQPRLLFMPSVPQCPTVCPLTIFRAMEKLVPTCHPNDPLLIWPGSRRQIFTIPQLAAELTTLLSQAGLDTSAYSLHSLRRGGASAAYQQGSAPADIQRHGTWQSSAMWGYIAPQSQSCAVASALSKCF